MINKPMTISSSLLSAAGPNKYNRIASAISPTITQASKRVVCVTVIIGYCKPRKRQLCRNLIDADGGAFVSPNSLCFVGNLARMSHRPTLYTLTEP
jgi:hypothetical protein